MLEVRFTLQVALSHIIFAEILFDWWNTGRFARGTSVHAFCHPRLRPSLRWSATPIQQIDLL